MNFQVLFFTIVAFYFSIGLVTASESYDGQYECSGNLKKIEFKIEVSKDGNLKKTTKNTETNGRIYTDTDDGEKFSSNNRILLSYTPKRMRVEVLENKKEKIRIDQSVLSLKGLKVILSPKKGLVVLGKISKKSYFKNDPKKTTKLGREFRVEVLGKEKVKHKTLGNLEYWKVKLTFSSQQGGQAVKSEANGQYNSKYGYLKYSWKSTAKGKEIYKEDCKLVSWK